jgi:valyl-tRNA synthetase
VMPFLTEEVWQRLPGHEAIHPRTICLAPYPRREERWEDAAVEAGMEALIEVVTRVRSLRAELGLPPKAQVDLHLAAADPAIGRFLEEQRPLIGFLCRMESITVGPAPALVPENARRDVVAGVEVALVAARQEMGEEERQRLLKELEKLAAEIARAEERLSNEQFLSKAPAHVVEGGRAKLAEMKERHASLQSTLGSP